jgi:glutaredoxin
MVTVYTTPTCAPCRVVKARLTAAHIPFHLVDLTQDAEAITDLKQRLQTPVLTTPIIEVDGELFSIASLPTVIARVQTPS